MIVQFLKIFHNLAEINDLSPVNNTGHDKILQRQINSSVICYGYLFGGVFFANAEYDKWIGWSIFVILMAVGIILHIFADKMKKFK